MGVTGEVGEFLELSKQGGIDLSAQRLLEIRQGRDPVLLEKERQAIGWVGFGSHNKIVAPHMVQLSYNGDSVSIGVPVTPDGESLGFYTALWWKRQRVA